MCLHLVCNFLQFLQFLTFFFCIFFLIHFPPISSLSLHKCCHSSYFRSQMPCLFCHLDKFCFMDRFLADSKHFVNFFCLFWNCRPTIGMFMESKRSLQLQSSFLDVFFSMRKCELLQLKTFTNGKKIPEEVSRNLFTPDDNFLQFFFAIFCCIFPAIFPTILLFLLAGFLHQSSAGPMPASHRTTFGTPQVF